MKEKILVVDNHPLILELMTLFLEQEGYRVATACGALDAIDLLDIFEPDIVFVDLVMPDIGGDKLCRIIRNNPKGKGAIIIILSAIAAEESIDFKTLGANACIAKGPFDQTKKDIKGLLRKINNGKLAPSNKVLGLDKIFHRQITKELLASRKHLESAINTISDGILELTDDNRVIFANKTTASLLKLTEERILSIKLDALLPNGRLKDAVLQALAKFKAGSRQISKESQPFPLKGRCVTFSFFKADGALNIYLRDVTAEHRLTRALKVNEKKYGNLFKYSNDWIVVYELDGLIIDANNKMLEQSGYTLSQILALNIKDLHPAEELPAVEHAFNEVMEQGFVKFETFFKHKDGKPVPAEVSASVFNMGNKNVVQCLVRDISERKEAEKALRESEERYKDLFENSTDLIQSVAPDGRIEYANRAWRQTLGYDESELSDLTIFDIIHPDHQHYCQATFQELKSGKQILNIETTFVTKDGRQIVVEGNINCKFENGVAVTTRGIFRDVTDRKNLEEKLRVMSVTDELTGLLNRRGVTMLAEKQLQIADRAHSEVFLIYLDLDNMKWINDHLGHKYGDQALIETADILKKTFRESDIIGRFGGDEFVVMLTELPDAGNEEAVVKRLESNIVRLNSSKARDYKLSLSLGIARYDAKKPCSVEELIIKADNLMYQAKNAKKASKTDSYALGAYDVTG